MGKACRLQFDWIAYLLNFGYLGVFLISLIGSLSVVFPIPYTIVIYALGSSLDPLFVAVVSGFGSAIGELSGYVLGYYGRAVVGKEMRRKMDFMVKLFDHYGPIAVFIFALTPLPDDLLFIPLGIMRYNLVKALVPCFFGKLLMSYILAYSGQMSFEFVKIILGEGGWLSAVITVALLVIIIFIMFKIDWEKIFEKYVAGKAGDK